MLGRLPNGGGTCSEPRHAEEPSDLGQWRNEGRAGGEQRWVTERAGLCVPGGWPVWRAWDQVWPQKRDPL